MATGHILRRRASTPFRPWASHGSGSGQGMPGDLLLQTCRRVGWVGLVAAGLWAFSLVMNGVVARLMGHPAVLETVWPYPALPVAVIGEPWTAERALHWWERHHPESARPAPARCGELTLTRTFGSDWRLEEGSPPLAEAAST
jgi:hypothetical protein